MIANEKTISIVVPVYNVKSYLRACLESVFNQTYSNYELILVNDGSTDGSEQICEEYAKRHSKVVYISQKNVGLSGARNTGISAATGEYICFVDSDDCIEPQYLEKMLESVLENNSDMAFCDYYETDENGNIKEDNYSEKCTYERGIIPRERLYRALSYTGKNHYATSVVVAWNKLIRTSIMKNMQYPVGKYHEDEFIIFDLITACDVISWVPESLYSYTTRNTGIMHQQSIEHYLKRLVVLDAYYERIDKSKSYCPTITKRFIRAFLDNCIIYNEIIRKAIGKKKSIVAKKIITRSLLQCYREQKAFLSIRERVRFIQLLITKIVL